MQVCTVVCGNTDVIASGNPLSPSTMAMRMSLTPRALKRYWAVDEPSGPADWSITNDTRYASAIKKFLPMTS
jgi:hypothetical protein